MSNQESFSSTDAIKAQQFADQALDEISRRAQEDGMDLLALHSAICVGAVGWIANQVGHKKTSEMLAQLATAVETDTSENTD